MYPGGSNYDMTNQQGAGQWMQGQPAQAPTQTIPSLDQEEEGDTSRRPANAFILYSQTMRSVVRQENPSLTNTEVSKLLGKMWKEVPNETKLQYKQKAAASQEEFKRQHPDYTYRKARRKRALNELLTKSTQGYGGFDPQMQMFAANPQMMAFGMPGMAGVPGMPGQMPGQMPGGIPGMPGQMQPGMTPTMPGQMQQMNYTGMSQGQPMYQ